MPSLCTACRPSRGGVDRNNYASETEARAIVAPRAGAWIRNTTSAQPAPRSRRRPSRGGVESKTSDTDYIVTTNECWFRPMPAPATNSSIRRSYETAVGFNASSSRRDRAGSSKRGLALAESGICSVCPFRRPCLSDGSEPTEPGEGGRRNMDKFFSNISLMQRKTKVREPPRIPSLSGRLSDQICPNVVSSNVHRRRK